MNVAKRLTYCGSRNQGILGQVRDLKLMAEIAIRLARVFSKKGDGRGSRSQA